MKAFLPTNNRYVNKLLILQILQLNQNGTLSGLPLKSLSRVNSNRILPTCGKSHKNKI